MIKSSTRWTPSQKAQGWTCVADRYDDGGFSGGSMERPALDRLLRDIEAGKVDCMVVYKVDRLSRSLMDFARIMEASDRSGVSFVSVTQQFNTTSPMGRLALNILLSFAQFERLDGEAERGGDAAERGAEAGNRPLDRRFKALAPHFAEHGFKVWNCTPGSGLTAFQQMQYARASAECSKPIDTRGWYAPVKAEAEKERQP